MRLFHLWRGLKTLVWVLVYQGFIEEFMLGGGGTLFGIVNICVRNKSCANHALLGGSGGMPPPPPPENF